MRIVVLVCALIGLAGQAIAADYRGLQRRELQRREAVIPPPPAESLTRLEDRQPVLRGSNLFENRPPDFVRWDGFYAGGHFTYGFATADFSRASRSLVAHALRETALEQEQQVSNWQFLGTATRHGRGFGGFIGYNGQWQDAVAGIELNYTRMSLSIVAPVSPITRATNAGGNAYVVTLNGAASYELTDLATFRGRVGWAYGNFMPYTMIGLAVARANIDRSVNINLTENGNPFVFTESDTRRGAFMYGISVGAGVEWSLMSTFFVRGEYEYLQFLPLAGLAPNAHLLRAGVGMRF